jgi:hypothetical protein
MVDDKYTILAGEVRAVFEEKFGRFSIEDFDKVAKIIRVEYRGSNVCRDAGGKSYDNLSGKEKDQINFMMGLLGFVPVNSQ